VDVGVGDGVIVEVGVDVGVGVGVGERCWLSACATIGKSAKHDVKSKAIATLLCFRFIRFRDVPRRMFFIVVFLCIFDFGFPFRVIFVIRHLFPEIRDEVPEKFRND